MIEIPEEGITLNHPVTLSFKGIIRVSLPAGYFSSYVIYESPENEEGSITFPIDAYPLTIYSDSEGARVTI